MYEIIIKIYIVWRQEKNIATKLEEIEPSALAENLQNFYMETRTASGDYHSRNTMKTVRSSLDRYLSSSPYRNPFSIIRNRQFKKANKVLDAHVWATTEQAETSTIVSGFLSAPKENLPSPMPLPRYHSSAIVARN